MSATPDSTFANPEQFIADLKHQLAKCRAERDEALQREIATAEVLQVINSSPGDLAPVFEALLDRATTLCDAAYGILWTFDGRYFRPSASHRAPPAFAEYLRNHGQFEADLRPDARGLGAMLRGEPFVHQLDAAAGELYRSRRSPLNIAFVELGGARSGLIVPLRKDGALLGAIRLFRQEVRPFTDKQITLLQNFAAQAVIAMENARLLTETREALEQQTATAEVLQVINSSPGELAPVFDAMLEKAMRLCQATGGALRSYDGDAFHAVAMRGMPAAFLEATRKVRTSPDSGLGRIERGEHVVQIVDFTDASHPRAGTESWRWMTELGGIATSLWVALRKEASLLGTFVLYRDEVRPFSDKEISLVENFAAQAVIAMENARLLTETREALEQQTATAEVLEVINSSPGDLAPVFDSILQKALRLCEASFGIFWKFDGKLFHAVTVNGAPEFADYLWKNPQKARPGSDLDRLLRGESVIHREDYAVGLFPNSELNRAFRELGGGRSGVLVALRRDDELLGGIRIFHQEVRPFTDKQIALLQNFAAQAVIAMENARLIDEIRQRQAELRVTFDNMGDGVVMFDEDLRLAAWNRNFQELLDLPDELLNGRPSFAEYFRYLAVRGEYPADLEAELRRGLADTGAELRLERTRPDGRVIEVRRNAVPGGGFVLIYSDITERKEAEARLRAARDTAEGALRELRAAQANLIHAEKMASLGQLTAGIAHEIKNPLNFVNNFAGLSVELLDELKEAAAPAVASLGEGERTEINDLVATLSGNLDRIAEHGRRADGIVTSMLLHSRGGSGERRQVDLNALVDEALNLAYHGARAQDQSFEIVLERDFDRNARPIELVPQDITRVLLNLIGNGFYAASTKRRAAQNGMPAALKVTTRDLGERVEIGVRDNGAGIPPEVRDKLFQPFFTTKPTGEGTGLGLSISWDIVTQQHGGTIEVDSRPGEYTEFTVRLPRSFGAAPK